MKRRTDIDILKAIGIISIVIGHSCWNVSTKLGTLHMGPFVYLYHIMVFMFVGGLCYNDKYSSQPFIFLGKRIGSTLPLYFLYNIIFVCLHNFLLGKGLQAGYFYAKREMVVQALLGATYSSNECLLGALWFVPMYVLAMGIFCLNQYFFEKIHREKWSLIGVVLIGTVGVWLNWLQLQVGIYHLHTSMLAVPVIWLGYVFNKYREQCQKYIHWSGLIAAVIVLHLICKSGIGGVELSICQIIHPLLFYPITMVGIYMCMALAKYIDKTNILRRGLAVVGRNSFHIMALHFLIFKLIDYGYAHFITKTIGDISKFPHSYGIWWIYIPMGVVLPVLLVEVIRKLFFQTMTKIKSRIG